MPLLNTTGGSSPCSIVGRFIVLNNSFSSVMALLFRDTFQYGILRVDHPLATPMSYSLSSTIHWVPQWHCFFRDAFLPQEQSTDSRPYCLFTHELTTVSFLIFFIDSHSILSTHRVHGTSAAWCFLGSIVQWYTGSGVPLPFPRPIKLLCCRCYLNFRRASDLHVPCYWCEMMQAMGYPPRS